jgi:hypothetical protein
MSLIFFLINALCAPLKKRYMAFFVFYNAVAGWKGLRVFNHFQERAHTVRNLLFAPQIADINVLYCKTHASKVYNLLTEVQSVKYLKVRSPS